MPLTISSPEAFALHIERVVANSKMSYLDAIIDFCNKRELDVESVVPFITSSKIKIALSREGQALHLLTRETSLFE